MDDMISRKAAIDELAEWHDPAITNRLNNLPTVDAVPVVRCRNCKSFSHGYCKFHDAKFVRPNGYCYWGERKDGDHAEGVV